MKPSGTLNVRPQCYSFCRVITHRLISPSTQFAKCSTHNHVTGLPSKLVRQTVGKFVISVDCISVCVPERIEQFPTLLIHQSSMDELRIEF